MSSLNKYPKLISHPTAFFVYIYNPSSRTLESMNIGFDAKRFFNNKTGLGNYSRTLVSNLCRYFPHYNYYLYTPSIQLDDEKAIKRENEVVGRNEEGV